MSTKQNQREQAISRIATHFLVTGLSQSSLRQLARAADVSDRMLLYYFSDKTDVVSAALAQIAGDLMITLEQAVPAGAHLAPAELTRELITLTRDEAIAPFMQLWIEIVAAAAQGTEPYKTVANQIATGFLTWITSRLSTPDKVTSRKTAALILAMIDGLALLDVCMDKADADLAASAITALTNLDAA